MNKLYFFIVILMSFACFSCSSDDAIEQVTENTEACEVNISFNGDITTESAALSRATSSTDDLIGIQVYKRQSSSSSWSNFAYGLYDHTDNIKAFLPKGYLYKFVATVVKDGKNKIYHSSSGGYYYPFTGIYTSNAFNYLNVSSSNYLNVSSSIYLKYLNSIRTSLSSSSATTVYPAVDRLYGELSDYEPSVNGTVELNLKRVSFGLKCTVNGVEEGTLSVTVKNDSKAFIEESGLTSGYSSAEQFYTFTDLQTAYTHADSYYENLTVSVKHMHSVGIEEDLGSVDVKVYRNKLNVINVNLSTSSEAKTGKEKSKTNKQYLDVSVVQRAI